MDWFIKYDKEIFDTIDRNVPIFSNQEHFWIPKELFTKLDVDIPAVPQ